jgi:hypothetical protein
LALIELVDFNFRAKISAISVRNLDFKTYFVHVKIWAVGIHLLRNNITNAEVAAKNISAGVDFDLERFLEAT